MDIIKLNTDLPVSYKKQGVEIIVFNVVLAGNVIRSISGIGCVEPLRETYLVILIICGFAMYAIGAFYL